MRGPDPTFRITMISRPQVTRGMWGPLISFMVLFRVLGVCLSFLEANRGRIPYPYSLLSTAAISSKMTHEAKTFFRELVGRPFASR